METCTNLHKTSNIEDDVMRGNILDAMNRENLDPNNHKELFKDTIPLILKESDIKFAFARACEKRKKEFGVISLTYFLRLLLNKVKLITQMGNNIRVMHVFVQSLQYNNGLNRLVCTKP